MLSRVQSQYETWPYPRIPLIAKLHRDQLWQIHLDWIRSRCGMPPLSTRPKIWIAGCGTFEPYVFSRANPNATILATDFSANSLKVAQSRCRWQGIHNVQFKQIDLTNEDQFPEKGFDLIECYGVLMCLPDPLKTLKQLAAHLNPQGVLRIMVYPHYSRQRVFQIQRLAKLLGLSFEVPSHPLLLKKIMKALPQDHPLSYGFSSYGDAQTSQGIVDGFLHASDRGYTGIELCEMVEQAELKTAFCFHRPWGQPKEMAAKLGLIHHDPALWLHYLDLWQSLKTNFILCLTKSDVPSPSSQNISFQHPLFNLKEKTIDPFHRLRLLSMALTGTRLASRTHADPLVLSPKNVQDLIKGKAENYGAASEILLEPKSDLLGKPFLGTSRSIKPNPHFLWRSGSRTINPLYDYLFDAYTFGAQWNPFLAQPLPSLKEQIARWKPLARPLEDGLHRFGLTPYGTYETEAESIEAYLPEYLNSSPVDFGSLRLYQEGRCLIKVESFLESMGIPDLKDASPSVMRQLWILLYSYKDLFLSPA